MKNKKILIIGGTGALGKTLIKLYQKDNQIRVFSRDEHKQVHLSSLPTTSKNVSFMIGDIKDKDSIRNAIEDFKPEIVINAAAISYAKR